MPGGCDQYTYPFAVMPQGQDRTSCNAINTTDQKADGFYECTRM